MAIKVNLNILLAKYNLKSNDIANKIGITEANLSILKTGKAKAIRFSTLDKLCEALGCQPGDLLEYSEDEPESE